MIILRSAVAVLFLVLVLQGCGPLVELEEENAALQARIDSLEVALVSNDSNDERVAELEAENLRLSDQNRDLSARLAEERNRPVTGASVSPAPAATPPSAAPVPAATPPVRQANTPSPVPVAGYPAHDVRIQPDMEWLTRYQAALDAYNSGDYTGAFDRFDALARGSRPNNHIDNCVFWLGQCSMMMGQYDRALALFTTVIGYAGANKIPDALYSRAETYVRVGDVMNARRDYQRLIDNYPGSARAADARQRLRSLR
jgi:TolA-binding protein